MKLMHMGKEICKDLCVQKTACTLYYAYPLPFMYPFGSSIPHVLCLPTSKYYVYPLPIYAYPLPFTITRCVGLGLYYCLLCVPELRLLVACSSERVRLSQV